MECEVECHIHIHEGEWTMERSKLVERLQVLKQLSIALAAFWHQ